MADHDWRPIRRVSTFRRYLGDYTIPHISLDGEMEPEDM